MTFQRAFLKPRLRSNSDFSVVVFSRKVELRGVEIFFEYENEANELFYLLISTLVGS